MNGKNWLGVGVAVTGFCLTTLSLAHHSYAQFDRCTDVTIEGQIDQIEWANPHIVVMVLATDGIEYRVEWFDLGRLAREGLSTSDLSAGDRVSITGALHKDPELKVLTLLSSVTRLDSGWAWSQRRERREPPAACIE